MSNERSSKPFKKIDCTRRGFLRMPGNALKIWLYYYTREGAERLAWASEEELCEATGLNRDVMYDWRNWLEENGWLKRMGSKHHGDGRFAMAIFRVKEGTVPEKKDGRKGNRVWKSPTGEPVGKNRTRPVGENQTPTSRGKSESVQSVKIGEEVEPVLQVEPQRQVEPFEVEEVSESVSKLLANSENSATPSREAENQNRNVAEEIYKKLIPSGTPSEESLSTLANLIAKDGETYLADVWAWNKKHKSGGLRFRSVRQFADALASVEDNSARVQFGDHDPADCPVCKPKFASGHDKRDPDLCSHCEMTRTDNKDRICDVCRSKDQPCKECGYALGSVDHFCEADFEPVGKGFDVEEA